MNNWRPQIQKYNDYLFGKKQGLGRDEALWKTCQPLIVDFQEDFYANMANVEELGDILGNPSHIKRLKEVQYRHWQGLLGQKLDEAYFARAEKIGAHHEKIGLQQDWYLASYARVMMCLLPQIAAKSRFQPRRMKAQLEQVVARFFVDIMISSKVYDQKMQVSFAELEQDHSNAANLRGLANTVVQVNATSFHLARLVGNAREVRLGSETISSAASQLVASVEQIAVNSESAAHEANESNQTAREGFNAIGEVTHSIGKMLDAVEETHKGIEELSEASSQIGQILSVIEDIANQTNLLALNATIEAARAGEAGKGFAIVASEVKNLASQTSKSTEDIARRIDALSDGMDKMRSTMSLSQSAVAEGEASVTNASNMVEKISGQVAGVNQKMLDISNILQEQKGATGEIAHSIASVAELSIQNEELIGEMSRSYQQTNDEFLGSAQKWFSEGSDQALCEMAKIDHVLFKKRIIDTIMDRDNWERSQVPDHHNCRLGKWYDTLNVPRIVNHPAFQALVEPHQEVHAAGKRALEKHASGDFYGAIAEIETMNTASNEVTRLLSDLSISLDEEQMDTELKALNQVADGSNENKLSA